jgi:hypothetical protein
MSFDPNNPPRIPPADCLDPEVWHEAYASLRQHEPSAYGRCANKHCRDHFPCFVRQVALRALLDSCTRKERVILPEPGKVAVHARCQWCDHPIALTVWGWLHMQGGFILCREVPPGTPPLTVAGPG